MQLAAIRTTPPGTYRRRSARQLTVQKIAAALLLMQRQTITLSAVTLPIWRLQTVLLAARRSLQNTSRQPAVTQRTVTISSRPRWLSSKLM